MGMIYAGILAALAALLFLSRKEEIRAGADTPTFSRYFLKPALWLYKRYERDESDEENRKRNIRKKEKGREKAGAHGGKRRRPDCGCGRSCSFYIRQERRNGSAAIRWRS